MINYFEYQTEKDLKNTLNYEEVSSVKHNNFNYVDQKLISTLVSNFNSRNDDPDLIQIKNLIKKKEGSNQYIYDKSKKKEIDQYFLNLSLRITTDYFRNLMHIKDVKYSKTDSVKK